MISYSGYDNVIKRTYEFEQGHVFKHWDILNDNERKSLLDELSEIDYRQLKDLFESSDQILPDEYNEAPLIRLPKGDDEKRKHNEARKRGIDYIKKGKVAAFVVAGGQGSRLGYEGPKGKFPVGPVSNKTLFQMHGEKICKYSKKYNVVIPWLVMTSRTNHDETVKYFKENNYFGLNGKDVIIFPQNMIPSLDTNGKLILQSKNSIFKNPDGHGGSLTALSTSGALAQLRDRGIELISYFQVDNPLVKIIDPVFIGFHIWHNADISSKAVEKKFSQEKIGLFVRFNNGRMGVIEYSDMPDEKKNMTDNKGKLKYSSGSIAVHLFDRNFIEKITSGEDLSLPFHTARKKIRSYSEDGAVEIEGFKFEKFVFDALQLTEKNVIFETVREEEFAPVKNASGVDSVESARRLMSDLHRKWLLSKGIDIPGKVSVIEISSLLAVEPDDLDGSIIVPEREKVYIER